MSNANDSAGLRPDAEGENGHMSGVTQPEASPENDSPSMSRDTQAEKETASEATDSNGPSNSGTNATATKRPGKVSATARWGLTVLACLWLAWCTAIGPLYRQFDLNPGAATLNAFSWVNGLIFVLTFCAYLIVVVELVRFARGLRLVPRRVSWWFRRTVIRLHHNNGPAQPAAIVVDTSSVTSASEVEKVNKTVIAGTTATATADTSITDGDAIDTAIHRNADNSKNAVPIDATAAKDATSSDSENETDKSTGSKNSKRHRLRKFARKALVWFKHVLMRGTDRWWKIALILLVFWLWVPTTLVTAFGADLRSQFREFSWAWNQWTGMKEPYIGFFSFVPMDIYPTAHYLWPSDPTYLTDQHNIVLTMVYGAVAALSRFFTGSNDWGIVALSSGQFLFAVFCVAVTADRFFNRPWLDYATKQSGEDTGSPASATSATDQTAIDPLPKIGPLPRFIILAFFIVCPLVLFSTISLTKSPLYAFAFIWWFAVGYELLMTRNGKDNNNKDGKSATSLRRQIRGHSLVALIVSTCVMLISAKYAWYILIIEIVILLLADRKRWKVFVVGMLAPLIIVHGGLAMVVASGHVIGGDPIESHGVQLQQIARVAKLNPKSIPQSARDELAPIFNLDQMAEAYKQQDADPVKSSGIQSKKVSYRWRTVTKADMANLDKAWLEIVKANPRVSLDALMAKSYGYFDIADKPYIDMTYYVSNDYVRNSTSWIGTWCSGWRQWVTQVAKQWSGLPVLGWIIHGNFYVIATLLIGAAEVIQRRWRTLATHIPLLLLMGVMITSPANNFERHMLPLVFLFGFILITFWQDSYATRQAKAQEIAAHKGKATHRDQTVLVEAPSNQAESGDSLHTGAQQARMKA
ncbi:DUF6020 family protein [Bifidobacterium sp. ESL0790]|uniref:DUF6020 family protein n=1 Tax=Bifidobacterium sp. ESL0790 TaxID=2983233 RepID=UPI0023F7D800|nr:DUF6020 family protein [Bifidobacterium sp. ESL0790]WEV72244.1 DUF6020 family protein [Bifidobacterium sp. ESL0790]